MRKITQISIPQEVKAQLEPGTLAYIMGECLIFVSRSDSAGWHLSISHPNRYPTWDEIKTARYLLTPNEVTMAMLLPPQEEYVNMHPNCFHLWQVG